MASLTLNKVGKTYPGGVSVVNDVSLEIADGEFCVFVGPSGCGKSTLLRMIAGLEDITEGDLMIGDRRVNDLAPSERNVAMVFQNYALYPHMSVAQNLGFGLGMSGVPRAKADAQVREVATMLQIDHLLERRPKDLSGGQRQRVAIGRALVRNPGVFLFDEPLSNLDAALRTQTRLEIARLHRAHGRAATVYVTHDQVEAMTLGDKIVVLSEGHVQQAGTPLTLYQQPANRFVATFIGSPTINLLPARVVEVLDGGARLLLGNGSKVLATVDSSQLQVGESVEVGLRPEHCEVLPAGVAPAADDTALDAEITLVEHLGESNLLYLKMDDGQELIVRGDGNAEVRLGDSVIVRAAPSALYLFKADGTACTRLNPGNMRSAHAR